jgi:methionyl-tRNA formyltransferase
MQMEAGLDTGPVLGRVECAIEPSDTGDSLHERLARLGAKALLDCLDRLERSKQRLNDLGVTYADKLAAADSLIRWDVGN